MSWPSQYTPYIWLMLADTAVLVVLAAYGWRHRRVPAAIPFALGTLCWAIWALASALELAAIEPGIKFLWFGVQAILQLPSATLTFVFVLAYAGLEKWLDRRNLVLLFLPSAIVLLLAVTNQAHDLLWSTIQIGEFVTVRQGPAYWPALAYATLLFPVQIGVLVWLFIRSPLHRWPAALILGAQLVARTTVMLDVLRINPFAPFDAFLLAGTLSAWAYFIALFRFRMLSIIPIGRDSVIERMSDGMMLLDAENRIADLNPAAAQGLALARRDAVGQPAAEALAGFPVLQALIDRQPPAATELALEGEGTQRYLQVHSSPLVHPRGFNLGRLILLQDVTEQKQARDLLLQQERALASLEEREHLARELHDSLSQELAFMNVQAQAVHELLASGAYQQADECVSRLASVARQAQADARDLMSGLMTPISAAEGFVPALRRFLDQFCRTYGIETELDLDERSLPALAPTVQVQLLRLIQEALTNVRKHARARHTSVRLQRRPDGLIVVIEDDGVGFDPAEIEDESGHFGLRIMRERTAGIGGQVEFQTAPGTGTRVVVRVPVEG